MPLKNHIIKYYHSYLFFFIVFFFLLFKNSLVWGEDGSLLWMPIVSEFLKGESHYPFSNIIFGGQNLREIYGEFSFWYIFRFFSLNSIQTLNLTFFVFITSFYLVISNLMNNLTKDTHRILSGFIFGLISFSPVIFNRVYSGHFNLLFAIIPFFSALLFLISPTKFNYLINLLCCSFAFGIQGYQILIYYFFYLPIFYFFLKDSKIEIKFFTFLKLFSSSFIALLISSVAFRSMFKHSLNPEAIRSINSNVVFSYITSNIKDIPSLFLVLPTDLFKGRSFDFFHETNYPLSITVFLLFIKTFRFKKTVITTMITILILWLFCSNIEPFNYISHLPLIKAFRVPQRVFLIPVFLMYFLFFYYLSSSLNITVFLLSLLFIFLLNFLPNFEFVLYLISFSLLFFLEKIKNILYKNLVLAFCVSMLFLGISRKVYIINNTNALFETYTSFLQSLDNKYSLSNNQSIIHFEPNDLEPVTFVSAANSLGIRTIEGYGHPIPHKFLKFNEITNLNLPITTNAFFFNRQTPNYAILLNEFKINKVVFVNSKGENGIEVVK